jgi:hypothetical protein
MDGIRLGTMWRNMIVRFEQPGGARQGHEVLLLEPEGLPAGEAGIARPQRKITTMMTFVNDGSKATESSTAIRMPGSESETSTSRMSTASVHPP